MWMAFLFQDLSLDEDTYVLFPYSGGRRNGRHSLGKHDKLEPSNKIVKAIKVITCPPPAFFKGRRSYRGGQSSASPGHLLLLGYLQVMK